MRAIVVGSGIAGLAVALALRRVGIDVTVYERASQLTEVGAGISLWANAFRALDHIGAGAAVRAVSLPAGQCEFRVREGHKVVTSFNTASLERQLGMAPALAIVHRADLVAALAQGLPASTSRYGYECLGAETRGSRAIVRFKGGHTDEADIVVGADGIRSAVRAGRLGAAEPRYAGYTCWRGVCRRPPNLDAGYFAEWWGRGRRFGIATLTGDRVYWWATRNGPPGGRAADERAAAAAAFHGWADPVPELIASTPAEAVLRNDILDRPPQRIWAVGSVVLVGDAAHAATPNFGQGGCLAIEDAVALARHISQRGNTASALADFVAERFPRTAALVNDSRRFGWVAQWEGWFACRLRDICFGLLLPWVGTRHVLRYAAHDVGPLQHPVASV
ncbi:MAG: FAD-dependent monooxygenase [Gemmataceae bacterium]|nr:FAD-dependent monooxygenase [Gemmataceae bacterium]MDW8264869.1 FAD-dependent monooxygenase [Gemmataceae bacterium]